MEDERPGRFTGEGVSPFDSGNAAVRNEESRADDQGREGGRENRAAERRRRKEEAGAEDEEDDQEEPRKNPVQPPESAVRGEVEQDGPVEDGRDPRREDESREGDARAGMPADARQREQDEGGPRPADGPAELGEERLVRANERPPLRDAVGEQERRGDGPRVPQPHAGRVRREEPQSRKPNARTVQDRSVGRETRPQPRHGNRRDGEGGESGGPYLPRSLPAPNPQPRDPLEGEDGRPRAREREEKRGDERAGEDAPDPAIP